MSSDDSSGSRPTSPIVLRLKLRYDDVEVMIQQFANNVGKSGLFLPTRSIQPIGAEIKFEIRLANDEPVLVGLGRVKASRPPDAYRPRAAFGMAIELMRVTPQSRALILRMLEHRRVLGLPELALPTADDLDAARRAELTAREPSQPLPPAPRVEPSAGEALLTAPRRTSGPIAIAKVLAVAPLPPEPVRRRRMAVSEVIESASGPVASVSVAIPGVDDDVDITAALSRARRLAGDALDAELEALCEVAAAPVEISVEAASAELARQLGGRAVRRDRSARWAPPPTTVPAPAAAPDPDPGVDDRDAGVDHAEAGVYHPEADAVPEPIADISAAAPAPRVTAEQEVLPEQIADEIHQLRDQDLEDVERTELGDIPVPGGSFETGFATEPSVADQLALAARLEAQLAEAEVEADADDQELVRALGAMDCDPDDADSDRATFSGEPPAEGRGEESGEESGEEIDDFEILAEADADDEDLLAAHGEQDASDHDAIRLPPEHARPPSELDFAARLDLGEDSDVYFDSPAGEFSTRHVLGSMPGEPAPDDDLDDLDDLGEPPMPPSHLESAQQALALFDTGDEAFDEEGDAVRISQPIFEPEPSNTFTIAGARPEPVELELDLPVHRSGPVARNASVRRPEPLVATRAPATPVVYKDPAILRSRPTFPSLLDSPVEDFELEHALEALDVDLDDLSIPHAATQLQRDIEPAPSRASATIRPAPSTHNPPSPTRNAPSQSRAPAATPARAIRPTGPVAPGAGVASSAPDAGHVPVPRRTTDDGVLIDFDDDE
jgi:hypothetical protein